MTRWRLLVDPPAAAAWNMALDEVLLECPSAPTVRLYRWSEPSLSLGVLQRHAEVPPAMAAGARAICRRITGGGAILHRESELTFSLAARRDDPHLPAGARELVDLVHGAVRAALRACGVAVDQTPPATRYGRDRPFDCFALATELDVTGAGRKLAGSAQRRTRDRMLMHGSIPDDPVGLAGALATALAAALGVELEPGEWTREERDRAGRLVESRHARREWVERR